MSPLPCLCAALTALCVLTPGVAASGPSSVYSGSVTPQEWSAFSRMFVGPEGRVIDTANGGISHSEGQGYGLILAWMAGDGAAFERIWGFTNRELRVRDDGLIAWKWAPGDRPRVKDLNNASDGDVLIAYALFSAAAEWDRPDYAQAATEILDALKVSNIRPVEGFGPVLLPGTEGFVRDAGVIVNPSYWVNEAFTTFADADPQGPWADLPASLSEVLTGWAGQGGVPAPEWARITSDGTVGPDADLDAGYGYNAMRIPLYAIRAGQKSDPALDALVETVTTSDSDLLVLSASGVPTALPDPGYKALAALARCAVLNAPHGVIPAFTPTDYYPSVLHLLSLSAARIKAPECVVAK